MQLELRRSAENYEAVVERIVRGFSNPIDAVLVGETMYVIEFGGGRRILEITFINSTSAEDREMPGERFKLNLYPNPSTGLVTMSVESAVVEEVRIEVYNVLGNRIAVPFSGVTRVAGSIQFEWDASRLAAGIYIVRAMGEHIGGATRLVRVD